MRKLLLCSLFLTGCYDYQGLSKAKARTQVGDAAVTADLADTQSVDGGETSDGDTTLDASQDVDLAHAAPQDMTPPAPDLSCNPFIADPIQETPCTAGDPPQVDNGSAGCYQRTCGCKNSATCTQCFWSPQVQVPCS